MAPYYHNNTYWPLDDLDPNNNSSLTITGQNSTWSSDLNWGSLCLSILILWGIAGNSLVCISIITERRLHNITNYFLFSLAAADLLVSLCVMPISLLTELNNGWWLMEARACAVHLSSDVFLCSVSIVHMSVMSLDRYLGISRPLKTRNKSRTALVLKITGCWLVTTAISCPIAFLSYYDRRNVLRGRVCLIYSRQFMIYGSILTFFIPFLIMAFTYTATVKLLREQAILCLSDPTSYARKKHTMRSQLTLENSTSCIEKPSAGTLSRDSVRHVRHFGSSSVKGTPRTPATDSPKASPGTGDPAQTTMTKALRDNLSKARHFITHRRHAHTSVLNEQKATKVLGVVFFAFFICWTPFFTVNMTLAICGEDCERRFPRALGSIFLWLGYMSSTINPLIYTVFNKVFRQAFRNVLSCAIHPLRSRARHPKTSMTSAGRLNMDWLSQSRGRNYSSIIPPLQMHSIAEATIFRPHFNNNRGDAELEGNSVSVLHISNDLQLKQATRRQSEMINSFSEHAGDNRYRRFADRHQFRVKNSEGNSATTDSRRNSNLIDYRPRFRQDIEAIC